jgi:hypothetical protein
MGSFLRFDDSYGQPHAGRPKSRWMLFPPVDANPLYVRQAPASRAAPPRRRIFRRCPEAESGDVGDSAETA